MKSAELDALPIRFSRTAVFLRCRFSTLYTCLDSRTGRPQIVRQLILPQSVSHQVYEKAREQFYREGTIMTQLSHRGLPRVLELAEEGKSLFQVLSWFEGETLSHVASHLSKLPTEKLLIRWMSQLAEVLGYLHNQAQPIIYRNLRPDTVLLTSQADVLLVDFGLARLVDTVGTSQTLFRRTGDTSFAPPEQFSGLPSTPDVDIYSLGATMYALATGKLLPSGWDRMFSMAPVVPLQSLNPYISEPFANLIHQMVNLEPGARPQTTEEIVGTLRRLQPEAPPAAPTPAPAPVFPEPLREPPTLPLVAMADGWKGPFFGRRASLATEEPVEPSPLDRWPVLDLTTVPLDRTVGQILPEDLSVAMDGVCIGHPTDYELLVAVSDPRQTDVRKHVSELSHHRFVAVVVRAETDVIALARRYVYGPPAGQPWLEWIGRQLPGAEPSEERGPLVLDGLYKVVQEALALRMTDLHLESHGEEVVLRHRVEGRVRTVKRWPRRQAAAWFYEIRRLGGLVDVPEALPCSGRARLELEGKAFDVRISLVPGLHGQNAVLRLVERVVFDTRLDDLGFSPALLARLKDLLQRRAGLLLLGGPKGSGTTTTSYAALRELENGERKLVTIEGPVEGEVPGTIQIPIDQGEVSWEQALREALCQDPDAVLLGELPDPRTVRLAAQAALEDHLVLSTVPVERAAGVVTELLERGLPRDVVAAGLCGCLAQRLVRQLCPACKVVDSDARALPGGTTAWRARGCEQCGQTGYAGRLALAELMVMTPELRAMVREGASEDQLQAAAERGGMASLLEDGMARVAAGLTTAAEVTRACRIL